MSDNETLVDERITLISLHKQRGAIKAKLTDFQKFVDRLATMPIHDLKPEDVLQLESRLNSVLSFTNAIDNLQTQIYNLSISDEDDEQAWTASFETSYFAIISKARLIQQNVSKQLAPATLQTPTPSINSVQPAIKLPTIALPKFDGQHTHWLEFHDIFVSLIHDSELPSVQKFHYLKASLEKEAAEIISNIVVSTANYDIAWNLLCERYTNNRLLIQNHIRALFQQKDIIKESASQLREHMDTATKHLRSLKALGQPTDHWDAFIIYLITSKFDKVTARDWEQYQPSGNLPTLEDLKTFINDKADMLDNLQAYKSQPVTVTKPQRSFLSSNITCYSCKGTHGIYHCDKFLKLSSKERLECVKRLKLCINCLKNNHMVDSCPSKARGCNKCSKPHNTLLHFDDRHDDAPVQNTQTLSSYVPSQILLATALVEIKDSAGNYQPCRALLDSGSQSNFMTKALQERLGLPVSQAKVSVQGINQVTSVIQSKCNATIKSRLTSFTSTISCLVMVKISDQIPNTQFDSISLNIPENIQLADPAFDQCADVDMLIGAQLFWSLLLKGQVRLGHNLPIMQNSHFGWIISGPVQNQQSSLSCYFTNTIDIQTQLQSFWELEECPTIPSWSQEQRNAERHFAETLSRDKEGRFVVKIPFLDNIHQLGDSYSVALKRFHQLEKRFAHNQNYKYAYVQFMQEYQALGHMVKIINPDHDMPTYYLPHHGVINNSSTTTKLRVVFDGSCASSSGLSINDVQMSCPTVQDNLFNILLRFRQHSIAFAADIRMMYRQVVVHPDQQRLQRILWRSNPNSVIETFQLRTVTYGTKSAPYLATRCLRQIASENDNFPRECEIIQSDFYVDDLLSGAETSDECKLLCTNIKHLLSKVQFPLHKWVSNDTTLLQHLNISCSSPALLQLGASDYTKTLGIFWSPSSDHLKYNISVMTTQTITKRSIISDISQVFDPIGLVSATTIMGKIILQRLWQLGVGWDDELPHSLAEQWRTFRSTLSALNQFHIPRHASCNFPIHSELHCFADASSLAYAACIYLKSTDAQGNSMVVHKCLKCFKCKPVNSIPLMGNLPAARVQPAAPFQMVGVDYAGPFSIKDRQGRGCKITKCYVAVFICMATKAIHIELVSSLSTEAFLASLRRFISRRGKPSNIFSDNGSNFVGANTELKKLINLLKDNQSELQDALSIEHISWSFTPPHAPNFGGLWEAGVKGMKYHLNRVARNAYLTFEQFCTLLCQVEAILNSRPLSPMSSHPNDLEPLTPAHFLIGRRLTALPQADLLHLPSNRLSEFERIQQLSQHFWNRWRNEYLHSLQQRGKWHQHQSNLNVGTMVLVKEENTPTLRWPLGRIIEVFPGKDTYVRVVSVQTQRGTYKRPVSKVFPLPVTIETIHEPLDISKDCR